MVVARAHDAGKTVQPRLIRRKSGEFASIATGTNFTLTSGDRVRVAIKDDPANAALQQLEVYVAGTSRFTSTAIDDDWSAGLAGFYVRTSQASTVTFDNCRIGYDNNADDDVADAGDDVQIDDDFASGVRQGRVRDGISLNSETSSKPDRAADLVLNSELTLPKAGDRIRETVGAQTFVHEVMAPGGEPPWRYSDPYRKALRIHTKHVSTE